VQPPTSAKPKKTGALRAAALGLLALAAPLNAQAGAEVQPPDAPALIQTTGAHPFWSETRQAWVPARELRAGEELRTQSGAAATVASLVRQPGSQPVFNLEVETEHVYFVGEAGVLVHNSCPRQLRWNNKIGKKFENDVYAALGGAKGKGGAITVTLPNGKVVTTVPDIFDASDVADIKNVKNLSLTEQLQAQVEIAKSQGSRFSIVVSDRTETISSPLLAEIRKSGGEVYRYTPSTGQFDVPNIVGNKVQ